jgi:hypothetical protein
MARQDFLSTKHTKAPRRNRINRLEITSRNSTDEYNTLLGRDLFQDLVKDLRGAGPKRLSEPFRRSSQRGATVLA